MLILRRPQRWALLSARLALLFLAARLHAQAPDPPSQVEGSGPVVHFGGIVIDKAKKSATFPAELNLAKGTLEYLLVTDMGKTHESLLSTKVQPYDLQVAMLLLGLKPNVTAGPQPPAQLNRAYLQNARELKGPRVDLLLSWHDAQGDHHLRGENLILNTDAGAPMTPGPWIYNGSGLYAGKFLAQVDGSIVALVRDSAAMVNNPRPGNDNDQIWDVNEKLVPPTGTPIDVTLQLETPSAK